MHEEGKTNLKEEDFYNRDIKGIPCFLKLPIPNTKKYLIYPDIDSSKFYHGEQYAIFTYINEGSYSTKTVLNVSNQTLNKIETYEKRKFSAPKLLSEANRQIRKEERSSSKVDDHDDKWIN